MTHFTRTTQIADLSCMTSSRVAFVRNQVVLGKSRWASYIAVLSAPVHPMKLCTNMAMVASKRMYNVRLHFQAASACTDTIRPRETLSLNTANVPRLRIIIGAQGQVQALSGRIIQLTRALSRTKGSRPCTMRESLRWQPP